MLGSFIVLVLTLIFITGNPFQGAGAVPAGFWNPLTGADGEPIGVFFLLSVAGWGLGAFGSQRILQRFMGWKAKRRYRPAATLARHGAFSRTPSDCCWEWWH